MELITPDTFPPQLQEITDPPEQLYARGNRALLNTPHMKYLTVVGSRACTSYGRDAVHHLISGLSGYPVVIVSGLALGIDGEAHRAALKAGLPTIAIPGSGLDDAVLYPRTHLSLARNILKNNGLLLSEYEPKTAAAPWTFPKRNRLLVGISHAVLLIEAQEKSGTLITARLTTDYNRDLLVVPGSIFSSASAGIMQFLKLGATPVAHATDILEALHIDEHPKEEKERKQQDYTHYSQSEQTVLTLLTEPRTRDDLARTVSLSAQELSTTLITLELKGVIAETGGMFRKIT